MTDRKVEIYTREDKIVINVDGWPEAMVLTPQGAAQFVETLHDAAVSLGVQERIVNGGSTIISDSLRQRMITRATHMLRCLEGKSNVKKAQELVDQLLAMI